jgi:hypothetical protein
MGWYSEEEVAAGSDHPLQTFENFTIIWDVLNHIEQANEIESCLEWQGMQICLNEGGGNPISGESQASIMKI